MDYFIITGKNMNWVIAEVNKAIVEGYIPLGNITVEYTGYINNPNFYQSMIKDNK